MHFYNRKEERTGVQVGETYEPAVDLQCDFVMVYGIDDTMPDRIRRYREKGYIVHLMTGVAWGSYVDFLDGRFDGRPHWDEGQITYQLQEKSHGKLTPYMSPSVAFANYLTEKIKVAVDAGVEAIHLEEPEFWVESGYSEAFKREWEIFYKEPWQDPLSSADAQFRASKLKSYLYRRTLDRLCSALKEYARTVYNRNVRFYVPTHSLVNYTQWRIVSPESSLIDLPSIDGYIAQIWTGTSRTENVYEGVRRERTFETAFLEYGAMQELTRGTGRRMWFLHDPIEDNPRHTWSDYRQNYYRTVVASLFHSDVYHYEICPWPHRVMNGRYPRGESAKPIPPEYATNLLSVMHTLRDMKQPDCRWESDNIEVGVLLADSGMFQRMYPKDAPENKDLTTLTAPMNWNGFFGLTLPLLKQGLAVKPVQLDNIRRFPSYPDDYHTLVLSYEFMKPEYPDIHNAIAQWVKAGGKLVYVGDGSDSFHNIRSWWRDGKGGYATPAEHLFEACGLPRKLKPGLHKVEKGVLYFIPIHPAQIALSADEANGYRDVLETVLKLGGVEWKRHASLVLHRGPYVVTANMDESVSQTPYTLRGRYIDLFTHDLRPVRDPELAVGSVGLYFDLDAFRPSASAEILAAAARITRLTVDSRRCTFTAVGPERVTCAVRIYTKRTPKAVSADGKAVAFTHDPDSQTTLIGFPNAPEGVTVTMNF